jgi:hypothetical protein
MKPRHAAAALLLVLAVGLTACTGVSTSTPSPGNHTPGSTVYRFGVVGNQGKIAQLELSTPAAVGGITGDVVQVATSNSDSYALTSNGEVWAWGVASYGELGDGQTSPSSTRAVRVDFPAGIKITALANPMPFDGALAIGLARRVVTLRNGRCGGSWNGSQDDPSAVSAISAMIRAIGAARGSVA